MCKHILNAQVSVRSPCCQKWFDCVECHAEQEDHPLKERLEMVFACKKCKKCFRKDVKEFEEADEYCPHCDNHFVLDAVTPKPELKVEGEDARVDSRMLIDERMKQKRQKMLDELIFDPDEDADKLG
ncbi:zinc finger protein [Diaporthe amygdali]|uniref:zinc finger protein n=1 Tax=Phomopsis amygdali TaxID=1214568 RepID=UPI0022FF10C9|nr:zinc finger protein [Diaporthe amygdali]KAJ0118502.1 zinc finger protein [Diaporthe amygdali]